VKVAALDVGTNTVRLLLGEVDGGRLTDHLRETTITRLGLGVDQARRLDPDAASRTRVCLERYATRVREFRPERSLLVATSVLRDAADGRAFLEGVEADFGLPWRIVTGEEEAALSFAGAASGLPAGMGAGTLSGRAAMVAIDIGGGSLELAVGPLAKPPSSANAGRSSLAVVPPGPSLPTPPASPSFARSLDVGVVRLTERFFAHDPPTDEEWLTAQVLVRTTLDRAVPAEVRSSVGLAVGLAGTFTTLVAVKLELAVYDRAVVHGHRLTRDELTAAALRFRAMTSAQRGRLPGIQRGREDVILAGVLLAAETLDLFEQRAVVVSEADLLDGIALSLAVD